MKLDDELIVSCSNRNEIHLCWSVKALNATKIWKSMGTTWNFNSVVKCTLCPAGKLTRFTHFCTWSRPTRGLSQAVKTTVKSITADHFEKNSGAGGCTYAAPCFHQYFIQQMRNARKKLPFSRLTPQRLLIWYRNNDHFFYSPRMHPKIGVGWIVVGRTSARDISFWSDAGPAVIKLEDARAEATADRLLLRFAWFYQFWPTNNEFANRMF